MQEMNDKIDNLEQIDIQIIERIANLEKKKY